MKKATKKTKPQKVDKRPEASRKRQKSRSVLQKSTVVQVQLAPSELAQLDDEVVRRASSAEPESTRETVLRQLVRGLPTTSGVMKRLKLSKEGHDAYGPYADIPIAGVTHRFRWVPPGKFMMGSTPAESDRFDDEGPQHEVEITKGYWLGDVPVTQELYEAVMGKGNNPSRFRDPTNPVEMVSWDAVTAFLERLNALVPGLDARRPTEAEWEYACRAGTTGARYGDLDAIAWHYANSGSSTHPVKQKGPNALGLYDMLGNVYEWCEDMYGPYEAAAVLDPRGPRLGSCRVIRGGSWDGGAGVVRAAVRFGLAPDYRNAYVGFRLARGQ